MPRRRFDEPTPAYDSIIVHRGSKNNLRFDSELKDQIVVEGNTVKLLCCVSGPNPNFKWQKNGKQVVWSDRIKNLTKDTFGGIKISNLTEADSGVYSCIIKNAYNELESTCKLVVYPAPPQGDQIPTFSRITDYYNLQVDDLVVEVHVRGIPTPTLLWTRDGRELDVENEYDDKFVVLREPDGVYKLCIHEPIRMDGGIFIIKAKNRVGVTSVRHNVNFLGKQHYLHMHGIYHADPKAEKPVEEDEPEPEIEPEIEEVVEEPVVAEEVPAATEDGEAVPPAEPLLDENGQPIEVPEKPKKRVRQWDKKPLPEPPKEKGDSRNQLRWSVMLKDRRVAEGLTTKFIVAASGANPKFTWYRNDIPIVFSKQCKNLAKEGIGGIVMPETSVNDAGVYKVVATNRIGSIECSCILTVMETPKSTNVPPTFTRLPKEFYNRQMNDLILEVHVRGKPMPTIKWFLDGLIIKEDTGKFFSLRRPDGVFQLCIHDPQVKDSGRYSIEAENAAGKEVLKHYVRVQPRADYLSAYEHGIKKADPRRKYEEELEEEKRQLEEQEEERRRVCRIALAIKAAELAEKLRIEEEEAARIAAEAEREARHERGEFTPEPEEEEFDWSAGQTYETYETYETTEEPEAEETAETEPEETAESPAAEVAASQPQSQTASRKQSVVPAEETVEPPASSEPVKETTPPAASEPVKEPTPPAPVRASAKATPRASASPARSVASVGSKSGDAALNSDGEPMAEGEEGEEVKPKKKLRLREKIFLPPKPLLASEQEVDPKKMLSFIVKMKDATVVEGVPVKLICSVDGPRPDIKWFKNNIPLVYNKHCKNQTTQTMGAVYFAHILPEDAGVYSCVVKNNFCEISTAGTVTVIASPKDKVFPPSFTRNMIETYNMSTDELVIECQIRGSPLIRVEWYKDFCEVYDDNKYLRTREPNGVHKLCIYRPNRKDSGIYMIQAENDFGKETLKHEVMFRDKEELSNIKHHGIRKADALNDEKRLRPRDIEALRQKEAEMEEQRRRECRERLAIKAEKLRLEEEEKARIAAEAERAARHERGEFTPEPTPEPVEEEDFDWSAGQTYGDDEEEDANAVEVTETTTEEVVYVEPTEEETPTEEEKPAEEVKPVEEVAPVEPPKPVEVPAPVEVAASAPEGETPAEVKETPPAEPEKPKRRRRNSMGFREPTPIDPKTIIKNPLWWITRLHNQNLLKGKTIYLSCCSNDAKKVEVIWTKDGEELEYGVRCKCAMTNEGYCTLEISKTTLKDAGHYKCTMKNAEVQIVTECDITIFELEKEQDVTDVPPTFTNGMNDTYYPATNEIVIDVNVRGRPKPTIKWICDGLYLESGPKYEIFNREEINNTTTCHLIINNAIKWDSGKYTIIAENRVKKVEMMHKLVFEGKKEVPKHNKHAAIQVENETRIRYRKAPKPEGEENAEQEQPAEGGEAPSEAEVVEPIAEGVGSDEVTVTEVIVQPTPA